jgi:hypothetical protein
MHCGTRNVGMLSGALKSLAKHLSDASEEQPTVRKKIPTRAITGMTAFARLVYPPAPPGAAVVREVPGVDSGRHLPPGLQQARPARRGIGIHQNMQTKYFFLISFLLLVNSDVGIAYAIMNPMVLDGILAEDCTTLLQNPGNRLIPGRFYCINARRASNTSPRFSVELSNFTILVSDRVVLRPTYKVLNNTDGLLLWFIMPGFEATSNSALSARQMWPKGGGFLDLNLKVVLNNCSQPIASAREDTLPPVTSDENSSALMVLDGIFADDCRTMLKLNSDDHGYLLDRFSNCLKARRSSNSVPHFLVELLNFTFASATNPTAAKFQPIYKVIYNTDGLILLFVLPRVSSASEKLFGFLDSKIASFNDSKSGGGALFHQFHHLHLGCCYANFVQCQHAIGMRGHVSLLSPVRDNRPHQHSNHPPNVSHPIAIFFLRLYHCQACW